MNGIEVSIEVLSELKGTIDVGASVRVEGIFVDGELHASEVKAPGRGRGQGRGGDEEDEDPDSIKIEGTVDALVLDEDGNVTGIVVNGVEVSIDALTGGEGALEVGSEVEIGGIVRDGVLMATEVELEDPDDEDDGDEDKKRDAEVEIEGVTEAVGLDADGNLVSITVDGQTVAIEPRTSVRGTIEVGAGVEIDAVLTDDGMVARNVRVRGRGGDDDSAVGALGDEDDDDGDGDDDDSSGSGSGGSDDDSSGSGSGGSDSFSSGSGSGGSDDERLEAIPAD